MLHFDNHEPNNFILIFETFDSSKIQNSRYMQIQMQPGLLIACPSGSTI